MEFTGIREAYDYHTTEGWVVMMSFSEQEVVDWIAAIQPDLWVTEYDPPSQYRRDINHPGSTTMLIRDRHKYLAFLARWWSDAEYMVCREDEDVRHPSPLFGDLDPWKIDWNVVPHWPW